MGCCDWCENRHLCGKYDDEKRYCRPKLYNPATGTFYEGFKEDRVAWRQAERRIRRERDRKRRMDWDTDNQSQINPGRQ